MKDEKSHQVAEGIRWQVIALLEDRESVVQRGLCDALDRFSEIARSSISFEAAGQIARSLAILLADYEGQLLDEQLRIQVNAIVQSLLEALALDMEAQPPEDLSPLVTPISPTSERVNSHVALFVDGIAVQTMLQEVLRQEGFSTITVNSLDELAQINEEFQPAAIFADISLIQLMPNAIEIFSELRQKTNPPPHLFCFANANDAPARLDAVRLGATRFVSKPVDVVRLIAVLKGVTVQTQQKPFRVLLIDDDSILAKIHEMALSSAGIEVQILSDPLQAPYQIFKLEPDVIVSDVYMPGCNGLELLAVLRQDDALADTPVVFLSSENDPRRQIEALDLGGDDFLTKPVDLPLFVATVIARAKRSRRLKRSRSEYHRMLERVREIERQLPESFPGDDKAQFQVDYIFPDQIPPADYVLTEGAGKPGVS
ncbi:MAG: response regulator [Azonexus sp.]|nr:response regulator [Azonexus sp.]